jgi:hypothetical protein
MPVRSLILNMLLIRLGFPLENRSIFKSARSAYKKTKGSVRCIIGLRYILIIYIAV